VSDTPLHFRARQRLSRDRDYRAVFDAGVRTTRGTITVYARPNGLPHARLGLSIGRRAGPAVTRVAIKRRLREAFRHLQHQLPGGYDLVVTVRAHKPVPMARYQDWLASAWRWLDAAWAKRHPAAPARPAAPPTPTVSPLPRPTDSDR
jgi:ribonuclease P protein component